VRTRTRALHPSTTRANKSPQIVRHTFTREKGCARTST
jgi:hypothetical protein